MPAITTGNTNKPSQRQELNVKMTVYYGLNCLTEQSSALWKHNSSISQNKDFQCFPTFVPQQYQISISLDYCVLMSDL